MPLPEEWTRDAFEAMGETLRDRDFAVATMEPPARPSPIPTDETRGLDPVSFTGKSTPARYRPLKRYAIGQVWGDEEERHAISDDARDQIDRMRSTGRAAPVELQRDGLTMRGNFYAAKGHNLIDHNYQPDTSRPAVLLLTGSGGSAEDQGIEMAQFYAESGASVLSVNYSGFGSSDDRNPGEKCLYEDAQAMLEHLVQMGYDPEDIVIHGFSMGAPVAAALEQKNENNGVRFRGAVLDRPMTHASDAAATTMPTGLKTIGGKVASLAGGNFKTKSRVKKLDPDTRKVVTADTQDLGPFGAAMLESMQNEEGAAWVRGAEASGGHFDHQAVIQGNGDYLRALIAEDREGGVQDLAGAAEAQTQQLMDMLVVLDEQHRQIRDALGEARQLVNNREAADLFEGQFEMLSQCDSAIERYRDRLEVIDEVWSSGIFATEAFEAVGREWAESIDELRDALERLEARREAVLAQRLAEIDAGLASETTMDALFSTPSERDPLGLKAANYPQTPISFLIMPVGSRYQHDLAFSEDTDPTIITTARRAVLQQVRDGL
ncbi:MAG: alpha/beta fold hydrolase [Planctomycetota bacterium]